MAKKFNLIYGDCLAEMETLIEQGTKVDMILCDLPYGTTACSWDAIIPFEQLWSCYKRLVKRNGAIALFSSQPFTTDLINSNRAMFKYEWIWAKNRCSNIFNADRMPMRNHENILMFYQEQPTYNPQKERRTPNSRKDKVNGSNNGIYGKMKFITYEIDKEFAYPKTVQHFDSVHTIGDNKTQHPTQKPDDLLQYLIWTYTNENELVIDNTMGSGSTGVACMKTNRRFIGIENDKEYFEIAEKRISAEANQIKLFFGEEKN